MAHGPGLCLVLVLTYAAHIVPAIMALVVIATITVVEALGESSSRRARVVQTRSSRASCSPPILAMTSVVALVLGFIASGTGGGLAMQRKSLKSLVAGLGA